MRDHKRNPIHAAPRELLPAHTHTRRTPTHAQTVRAAYGSDRAYKPYPPTPKQLANQKLFAKRAKSGAFKRKRKK